MKPLRSVLEVMAMAMAMFGRMWWMMEEGMLHSLVGWRG